MKSIWNSPFVVMDLETTGSDPEKNRITDVACVLVENGEIVSKFSSLVNPHQFIPSFIAKMTGISNEMAFKAPEAKDVFPKCINFFENKDTVFVAHNVRFDWSFFNISLEREGFSKLQIRKLCSLKLARRILPKNIKKNVGDLSKTLGIPVRGRHRALGDAEATAHILIELLERAEEDHNIKTIGQLLKFQNLPIKNFQPDSAAYKRVKSKISSIPAEPGIYYFYGKNSNLLYIGKSKSLSSRVKSYFQKGSITSKKIAEMVKRIHFIDWKTTGSELNALLAESREIKKYKPPYNTMEKRYRDMAYIRITQEDFPILEITNTVGTDNAEYFGPFRSFSFAHQIIEIINKKFKLRECDHEILPDNTIQPCFYYQIKRCLSPCSMKASREDYYKEIENVKYFLSGFTSDGIVSQLEVQMKHLSENLEFEKANMLKSQLNELRRIFEQQGANPVSIEKNNLIFLQPHNISSKSIDIYFIKSGRLSYHQIIKKNGRLNGLATQINETYFNGNSMNFGAIEESSLDELRIISYWISRHRNKARLVSVDGHDFDELIVVIEDAIREIHEEVSQNSKKK